MAHLRNRPLYAAGTVTFGVILLALLFIAGRYAAARHAADARGVLDAWLPVSGRWSAQSGVISNNHYGRGDMLISRQARGPDYRISADIRFNLLFAETHYGDAGLTIRTTNPATGVDSYRGYYAGLRPDSQSVVFGRSSFDWQLLAERRLAVPVALGHWYRLQLSAQDCYFTVIADPGDGQPVTTIGYQDSHCLSQGVAGLRSFYAQASWRNVRILPN